MKEPIIKAFYEFEKIEDESTNPRLLCSAKYGKINFLEEIRNRQGAIVIRYDGRLLLSENIEPFKDCDGSTFPKNTISFVDLINPDGAGYFRLWYDSEKRELEEVLILPADYYDGGYRNFRIFTAIQKPQCPRISLNRSFLLGDLNEEIKNLESKKNYCL